MNPPPNGSVARHKKRTDSTADASAGDRDPSAKASKQEEAEPELDLDSSWDDLVPPSEPHIKPTAAVPKPPSTESTDTKARGLPSSFAKPSVPKPNVPKSTSPPPITPPTSASRPSVSKRSRTRAAAPPPPITPAPSTQTEAAPGAVPRADTGALKPWQTERPSPPAASPGGARAPASQAETEARPVDEAEHSPAKRAFKPLALPRPGMLQPGHEPPKSHDFREAVGARTSHPSAPSSVPKGIRPPKRQQNPGASERVPAGQTASFINSVAVELIAAAEREAAERAENKATESAEVGVAPRADGQDEAAASVLTAAAADASMPRLHADVDDDLETKPRRSMPLMVLGAAAMVALLLVVFASGDDTPADASAESSPPKQALAANAAAEPEPAVVEPEPAPEPQPEPVAVIEGGSTGALEATATEGVMELDGGPEPIAIEDEAGAAAETAPQPRPEPKPTRRTSPRSSRRTQPRSPPEPAAKPEPKPTPAPAPRSSTPSTPKELRAAALEALGAGNATKAYQLAAQSNRMQRSSASLRIMVKAACRMKSQAKAKAAFDRLSIADRGGIRAECRRFGVKLGL